MRRISIRLDDGTEGLLVRICASKRLSQSEAAGRSIALLASMPSEELAEVVRKHRAGRAATPMPPLSKQKPRRRRRGSASDR
jgi:hypothetical protein